MFRMDPALRRTCLYLLAGAPAFVWLSAFLGAQGLRLRPSGDVAFGVVWGVLALVLVVLTQRARVRVDDAGVWQRFLIRWDLWPWAAFTDGRVRRASPRSGLEFPTKRWPHRLLILPFLAGPGSEALVERIERLSPPAPPEPPPALPETMTIRYALFKRLELSQHVLRVVRGRRDIGRFYTWSMVQQVRILRDTHACRDFRELEIDLPQLTRPIRLVVVNGSRSWRGPESEVLVHYLEQRLPPDRIELTARFGPPRTAAEADRMLVRLNRLDEELRSAWWFTALSTAGSFLFLTRPGFSDWDRIRWIAAGVLFLLLAGFLVGLRAACADLRRRYALQRDQLSAWRAELANR